MVTDTKTLTPAEKARRALAEAEEQARLAEWRRYRRLEERHRKRRFKIADLKHGQVTTYRRYGCRCVECTRANTDYMREYNRRRREANPKVVQTQGKGVPGRVVKEHHHGTDTGYVYGCRCDRCREAHRLSKPKSNINHGTQWAYEHYKCRCRKCVKAIRIVWRENKRRRGSHQEPQREHGTRYMYDRKGCRCTKCKTFMRAYWREMKNNHGT